MRLGQATNCSKFHENESLGPRLEVKGPFANPQIRLWKTGSNLHESTGSTDPSGKGWH